jgi:hypothetical protein
VQHSQGGSVLSGRAPNSPRTKSVGHYICPIISTNIDCLTRSLTLIFRSQQRRVYNIYDLKQKMEAIRGSWSFLSSLGISILKSAEDCDPVWSEAASTEPLLSDLSSSYLVYCIHLHCDVPPMLQCISAVIRSLSLETVATYRQFQVFQSHFQRVFSLIIIKCSERNLSQFWHRNDRSDLFCCVVNLVFLL